MKLLGLFLYCYLICMSTWAEEINQNCQAPSCIQVAINNGTINIYISGTTLQISANYGVINAIGDEKDKQLIASLEVQLNSYIERYEEQESRLLTAEEKLNISSDFIKVLQEDIRYIVKNTSYFDTPDDLKRQIELATQRLDRETLKTLLKKKSSYEKKQNARSDFDIGLLHFHDLEFDEALHYFKSAIHSDETNVEYMYFAGLTSIKLGNFDGALKYSIDALHGSGQLDSATLTTLNTNLGVAKFLTGDLQGALNQYLSILAAEDKYLDVSSLANLLTNIGMVILAFGDQKNAIELQKKALSILQVHSDNDQDITRRVKNNLAVALTEGNQYEVSEKLFEELLDKLETNNDNYLRVLNNYGTLLVKTRKYDKAESIFNSALTKAKDAYGPNHLILATIYSNMAQVHSANMEYYEAIENNKKAIKIDSLYYPENHPLRLITYNNIGVDYSKIEKYEEALNYYEKAIDGNSIYDSEVRHHMAKAYLGLDRIEEATEQYYLAIAIENGSRHGRADRLGYYHRNLAFLLMKSADFKSAIDQYERSLQYDIEVLGENSFEVAVTAKNIGICYQKLRDTISAKKWLKFAYEQFKIGFGAEHPETIKLKTTIEAL